MPFVVIDMSSSGPTSRNMETSVGRSARTLGSPPVTLIERTPSETKIRRSRVSSSKVRISSLGSHFSPSAGMQNTQRKLQRSVTEMRRSSATRPNVSRSGPSEGGAVCGGCQASMGRTPGYSGGGEPAMAWPGRSGLHGWALREEGPDRVEGCLKGVGSGGAAGEPPPHRRAEEERREGGDAALDAMGHVPGHLQELRRLP